LWPDAQICGASRAQTQPQHCAILRMGVQSIKGNILERACTVNSKVYDANGVSMELSVG